MEVARLMGARIKDKVLTSTTAKRQAEGEMGGKRGRRKTWRNKPTFSAELRRVVCMVT